MGWVQVYPCARHLACLSAQPQAGSGQSPPALVFTGAEARRVPSHSWTAPPQSVGDIRVESSALLHDLGMPSVNLCPTVTLLCVLRVLRPLNVLLGTRDLHKGHVLL